MLCGAVCIGPYGRVLVLCLEMFQVYDFEGAGVGMAMYNTDKVKKHEREAPSVGLTLLVEREQLDFILFVSHRVVLSFGQG